MNISRRQFFKKCSLGLMGFGVSYPFFIERNLVRTNVYQIAVPHLPAAFTGFRIVHLTDLHYGFLVSLSFLGEVISRANALAADIIVCTGDYVHQRHATAEIDAVWPLLSQLKASSGVYSVLGNHDHWASTSRSQYWLERTGQNLRRKTAAIERQGQRLWLAGAGDLWQDPSSLDVLLKDVPVPECRIVLAHNPDTADSTHSCRIDLMICGHTHGGQVHLPFVGPPILPVRNKNYSSGLKSSAGGTQVFISRGIGWAILPLRLNCSPEIAVLELQPA